MMLYNICKNFANEEKRCNFATPKGIKPDAKAAERPSGLQENSSHDFALTIYKDKTKKIFEQN
ncbi:MAG: hypothetical protein K2M53_07680 [Muribaculaceae bacterium]|nr:hypothetical protein [Muribaculaceae bacterium]